MSSPQKSLYSAMVAGLSLSLLTGCGFDPTAIQNVVSSAVKGSGVAKTEQRPVADFTEIDVGGAVNLELTVGPATKLEVTTDDNLLSHVKTESANGRLNISMEGSTSTNLGIRIKCTTPSLKSFRGSGATTSTIKGVKAERFAIDLSGASNCTPVGEATHLTVECSGASQAYAAGFRAKKVKAESSGASTIEVKVTEDLTAEASGASTINYSGSPAKLHKDASGASTISPRS